MNGKYREKHNVFWFEMCFRFPSTSPLKPIPNHAPVLRKKSMSIMDRDSFFKFRGSKKFDKEILVSIVAPNVLSMRNFISEMCNIHLLFHTGKCGSRNSRISNGIILRWYRTLQGAHRGGHSSDLEECDTYTVSRPPPTPCVPCSLYALKFAALHQKYFLFAVAYKEVRSLTVILWYIAWF